MADLAHRSLAKRQVVGFWRGFTSLFEAARSLLGMTRAWPYAVVPGVVFTVLEVTFVAVAWQARPWVEQKLSGGGEVLDWLGFVASWLSVLGLSVLGWLVALFLTPPLSAPALERIVALVEKDVAAPEHAPLGFFAEFSCGFRAALLGAAVTLPIVLLLTLLGLSFPPAAVVTTPLKVLIGALGVAWGLFDYPLTLRGVGMRQRFAFMRRNLSVVLGFGAAFALLFWLPCCSVVMLPIGVVAATRLVWEIERASPVESLTTGSR